MTKKKKLSTQGMHIFSRCIFITKTAKETRNLGKKFASLLSIGDIIFLKGELGSGKTTFAQGIIEVFCNKKFARSPSFTIINEYNAINFKIFHIDLYRLEFSITLNTWIEEYLHTNNISIIEWADKLLYTKINNYWNVKIENKNLKRRIKIKKIK
ncbi:MAG: tRNA (adenosine(37)-N6)-threonylcarbamoyltransferase complex ATPase subunit type 1 TsaE [Endomicrobium sp.]|jgi:tRNA threonylcarbamoyladenosine biosynthesis protein TsaE|nr:tRNA (adenosine(37)-N6)-threonylcarbamoyltransferase complex ATPase subunit type 1 TsaE [Endomicrobium sp.]